MKQLRELASGNGDLSGLDKNCIGFVAGRGYESDNFNFKEGSGEAIANAIHGIVSLNPS